MTDLSSFLDSAVPSILRQVQRKYPFVVVGTRAINAYLLRADLTPIPTQDWDVGYIGDEEGQTALAREVLKRAQKEGYRVDAEYHPASGESDNDPYALRSREWLRLTVDVGEAQVAFLDVYRIPVQVVYMEKDGLNYSDLGFLVRELDRSEKGAQEVIKRASCLADDRIHSKVESARRMLGESALDLDLVDAESDALIEAMGQVPDSEARKLMSWQLRQLEQAKLTLQRVAKERDVIVGAVASGKVSKELSERVCEVARNMETQYSLYKGLVQRCAEIGSAI